jgi:dTDP-4-amino-4,6-dideoxygalactose transaminase
MNPPQILLNDFRRVPAAIRDGLETATREVVGSGWYILGQRVRSFEHAWADYCGVSRAVGVGNGMDAIEIGLRCLGIGAGDEVITTPFTAFATVLGIIRAGATPVLADIDPGTGLLSLESAARCVGPRTRAVLLVHLYGQVRAMKSWEEFCAARRLHLLEDAAQAHGAEWHGRKAGAFGTWGAFSFYPTKNLGAIGDGGALVTSDAGLADQAARLRNYGQADRYHHPVLGLNSRLDELQAAFLEVLLKELPAATERRRAIAARYHAEVRNPRVQLLLPPETPASHVYHLFVVRCAEREKLGQHLSAGGIQTLIHYPVCAHQQPPCAAALRDPRGLPGAEQLARDCLSVPCHPYLDEKEVTRVVGGLNSF